MNNELFEHAMEYVFEAEGGYVNDENDLGGETKYGISKRAHPDEDIKNLTKDRAREIYKEEYWDKVVTGKPAFWAEDIVLFDTAIHMGVKQGLSLREQMEKLESLDALKMILFFRLAWYAQLGPKYNIYMRGFVNRLLRLAQFIHRDMPQKDPEKYFFVHGGLK